MLSGTAIQKCQTRRQEARGGKGWRRRIVKKTDRANLSVFAPFRNHLAGTGVAAVADALVSALAGLAADLTVL